MEKRNLVESGRTPQFDKQAGADAFDKQAKDLFRRGAQPEKKGNEDKGDGRRG